MKEGKSQREKLGHVLKDALNSIVQNQADEEVVLSLIIALLREFSRGFGLSKEDFVRLCKVTAESAEWNKKEEVRDGKEKRGKKAKKGLSQGDSEKVFGPSEGNDGDEGPKREGAKRNPKVRTKGRAGSKGG